MSMSLQIRPFRSTDLAFGQSLSESADWNQLPADWRRVLSLEPRASYVAELDGQPVGTVTACVFDSVAWIGLMLVEPAARGRGVGRALMERVLETLQDRGVATIRLDATPLGQPLYEKLGFRVDGLLQRFAGTVTPLSDDSIEVRTGKATADGLAVSPMSDKWLDSVARLDFAVTRTSRRRLLEQLWREWPDGAEVARRGADLLGFAMRRAGRRGTLIGPCVGTGAAARMLLRRALRSLAGGPAIIDIPLGHEASREQAVQHGLLPIRPLTRMTLGVPIDEDLSRVWASSGPEKG